MARFGAGQVTTYVILGMGEDPELTVEGCRRAIDIGVYPFVVPLRPVAGSLMADWSPPAADRRRADRAPASTPYLQPRGLGAEHGEGRAAPRCHACSPMAAVAATGSQIGRKPVRRAVADVLRSRRRSPRRCVPRRRRRLEPSTSTIGSATRCSSTSSACSTGSDRDERDDDPATIKVLGVPRTA